MTADRRAQIANAYRETFDLDLALSAVKATEKERKEAHEDLELRSMVGEAFSLAYAYDMRALRTVIDECLESRSQSRVVVDKQGKTLTVPPDRDKWLESKSPIMMKAIDMMQSIAFKQREDMREKDKALNIFFHPLSKDELETDPKIEVFHGKGELEATYGKDLTDDSLAGEIKRQIENCEKESKPLN